MHVCLVQDYSLIFTYNPSGFSFCLLFTQDDDIDGEHIIAFAEESDPGREKPELLNMWGTGMQIIVNFYLLCIHTVYLVLLLVNEAYSNYSPWRSIHANQFS